MLRVAVVNLGMVVLTLNAQSPTGEQWIGSREAQVATAAAWPPAGQTEPEVCQELRAAVISPEDVKRQPGALKQVLDALDEARRRLGPENMVVARLFECVGSLRGFQRDYSGAAAAFEQSLQITEKAFGADHIQVANTLLTIAMLTHKQGYYAAAEPLYRRALRIFEHTLGPKHVQTAVIEASIAKLYLAQERTSQAEELLEQAIPVLENAVDTEPATLAVALNDLAQAYERDGRYGKAEPLYAQVVPILEKHPTVINEDIQAGLRAYVQMLRKMKRKPEALQLERQIKTLLPR